jgi:hypothetical protein
MDGAKQRQTLPPFIAEEYQEEVRYSLKKSIKSSNSIKSSKSISFIGSEELYLGARTVHV